MNARKDLLALMCGCSILAIVATSASVTADPCGMVPPMYTGPGSPIARAGLQQTYVFYYRGVESFVIRPAFSGKVDNFGMLIPFPTPPAIRKVADNVFDQIENAIDPPEVVVDLRPRLQLGGGGGGFGGGVGGGNLFAQREAKDKDRLEVLNEEAVGMYEVAVLSAGSANALKKWMAQNKYQYPKGMDAVTDDYIKAGWCFVAVKSKIGQKSTADPKPGQRVANPTMPAGAVFDGAVQALGFRFRSKKLVVPMRLSAFNEGELRNVVYLLTRGAKKIRDIPEEYVVRQLSGTELVKNLTSPVPLRIIGGSLKNIARDQRPGIDLQRQPGQYNGIAKALFASDIRAVELSGESQRELSLVHETTEKELSRISEHFGLRGPEIDLQTSRVIDKEPIAFADSTLPEMRKMTLTVVDGDFPREVVANQNLSFGRFSMTAARNSAKFYDAKLHAPAPQKSGSLYSAADPWKQFHESNVRHARVSFIAAIGMLGILLLAAAGPWFLSYQNQPIIKKPRKTCLRRN